MSTSRRGHIVVATSGSAASTSAIAYAAREAQARGLQLEVVHVIPSSLPVGAFGGAPDLALRRSGREVLALGEQVD
jgi:nucleotide-binding universal stress UspA family protein